MVRALALFGAILLFPTALLADVGDPQVRTDHPWYPGELACSTFDQLFATQAEIYQRVTGTPPTTDEQKALAAWLWRNTHLFHSEDGVEDIWAKGFLQGGETKAREYWTGLFAHGFALCGTTHAQWVAEMEALLGHNRARVTGVAGHNSFEVFLTGGAYGEGKWVLLDHDISTVIYNKAGTALIGLAEIKQDWKHLTDRSFMPQKQHGWLVCGLHPDDGGVYKEYRSAEYLAGYAGPPPTVHLRRGESFRRYLQPGLEDGRTFAYWGFNNKAGKIPGPERAQTWVNQPEKMFNSKNGTPFTPGQARYGNAVYIYHPDFTTADYHEGVVDEAADHVTFEFVTPYIIAATPANDHAWGIYEPGCRNGLVLSGKGDCLVSLSLDCGKTWQDCGKFRERLDLTDRVKGRRQYLIKFHAGAKQLAQSGLVMTTTCQANPATIPRLQDGMSTITFQASGRAVVSAGPCIDQARAHLIAGEFGTPKATMEVATPRGESIAYVYAAALVASGSPPREAKYRIELSTDGGKSWKTMVKDWSITRRGDEPKDFWSMSFCWGDADVKDARVSKVQIRFSNDAGVRIMRSEAHIAYRTGEKDGTRVTFHWTDSAGAHTEGHDFSASQAQPWKLATAKNVVTDWMEFKPVNK